MSRRADHWSRERDDQPRSRDGPTASERSKHGDRSRFRIDRCPDANFKAPLRWRLVMGCMSWVCIRGISRHGAGVALASATA